MNEKDLAAQPSQTREDPRLSRPHEDPRREEGSETPPPEGPRPRKRLERPASAGNRNTVQATPPTEKLGGYVLVSLKGDRAFQRLRKGKPGRSRLVNVRWLPLRAAKHVQVGLVVSKKVGKAVVRNKVRRRLREILRRMHLPPCELVVVAQPDAAGAEYAELWKDLSYALMKSGLIQ